MAEIQQDAPDEAVALLVYDVPEEMHEVDAPDEGWGDPDYDEDEEV